MPEAHDPVAGEHPLADPAVDAVGGADGVQGVEGAAGGTAVQRTGECADGGHQAGGDVRPGGGDDAAGEGRGVETVVDGGDQVLLHGPDPAGVRYGTGEHVEVVGRVGQVGTRLHRFEPPAEPVQRGQHGGDGGTHGQSVAASPLRIDVVHRPEAGRGTEQGECRTQPRERTGRGARPGYAGQRVPDLGGQPAQPGRAGGEVGAGGRAGQFTLGHQVPDVLETAGLRQFDRRVLTVVVEALAAPDVSEGGIGDDDTRESPGDVERCVGGGGRHCFLHGHSVAADIDSTVYA